MSDVFGLRGSTGVAAGGAGYGGNPLVAAPVDTTTPFSGLRLIDDGFQIQQAIKNGDWLSGSMAGVAAVADGLQFAFNPIAGVVSWVVGWILDHVEPLKGWLNDLTGDAGEVSAASATWTNISTYLMSAGDELLDSLDRTLAQQTSLAVEAYKRLMKAAAEHLEMASGLADAISSGLMVAATIVQIVHDLVRDAISDIIGQFASAVIQAALSLGTLVPKIVADIAWKVSSWVTRIGTKIDDVIRSSDRLSALFKKADDLLARLKNVFNRIIHGTDNTPAATPRPKPDGDNPLQTGGSSGRPRDPDAADIWAAQRYEAIRADDSDVAAIADGLAGRTLPDGTQFSVDDIAAIKSHVFNEEHPLTNYDGPPGSTYSSRYDPDADMAEAWDRLTVREGTDSDFVLLQHEFAEHQYYVTHQGASYSEAHVAANQIADWSILSRIRR